MVPCAFNNPLNSRMQYVLKLAASRFSGASIFLSTCSFLTVCCAFHSSMNLSITHKTISPKHIKTQIPSTSYVCHHFLIKCLIFAVILNKSRWTSTASFYFLHSRFPMCLYFHDSSESETREIVLQLQNVASNQDQNSQTYI